jgi:hypothetical protein
LARVFRELRVEASIQLGDETPRDGEVCAALEGVALSVSHRPSVFSEAGAWTVEHFFTYDSMRQMSAEVVAGRTLLSQRLCYLVVRLAVDATDEIRLNFYPVRGRLFLDKLAVHGISPGG